MVPETLTAGAVCLYKAHDFPSHWSCVAKLVEGQFAESDYLSLQGSLVDVCVFHALSTRYTPTLLRIRVDWSMDGTPAEPIISGDKRRARPAGRILEFDNKLFRFAQDCIPQYGSCVRTFEILKLTPTTYTEVEVVWSSS